MKYVVEHPTMKIERNGNMINGSGVPVTSIKIISNSGSIKDFENFIDIDIIVKMLDEIDWEYLLGTGHWTPRLDEVVRISAKDVETIIDELKEAWFQEPKKRVHLTKRIYSGISNYYYDFSLIVANNEFYFKVYFN